MTEGQIQALIGSPTVEPEEKRLVYVALSRAMNQLFLIAEAVETESLQQLPNLRIEVVILS